MTSSLTRVGEFITALRELHGYGWQYQQIATVNGVTLTAGDLDRIADMAADSDRELLMQLTLPLRIHNALVCAGIRTVEQVAARSTEQLMEVRGVGVTAVRTVEEKLAELGLKLADGGES